MRDNVFRPRRSASTPGTTVVRWVNDGRNPHNVKPDEGSDFGSGNLRPGQVVRVQVRRPGTFAYYCTLHGTPDQRAVRHGRHR